MAEEFSLESLSSLVLTESLHLNHNEFVRHDVKGGGVTYME